MRIGTRGSQLALIQTRSVAEHLAARGVKSEIVVIKTSGDQAAEAPLSAIGGKRLFVKEIEDALLEGTIDLAVHSSKDMPVTLPSGLQIAAVLPREDPSDAIVLRDEFESRFDTVDDLIAALGQSPRVGTSSVRRAAQLKRLWPHARLEAIRGNLDTRLRKLDAGEYDVLVLAAAGLRRLGREDRVSFVLPHEVCLPAPGQGIIAIETRTSDTGTSAIVAAINDHSATAALTAERAMVVRLGGGCQTPIGALAEPEADRLRLRGIVVSLDGEWAIRHDDIAAMDEAAALGERVAIRLIEDGASEILAAIHDAQASVEGLQP